MAGPGMLPRPPRTGTPSGAEVRALPHTAMTGTGAVTSRGAFAGRALIAAAGGAAAAAGGLGGGAAVLAYPCPVAASGVAAAASQTS